MIADQTLSMILVYLQTIRAHKIWYKKNFVIRYDASTLQPVAPGLGYRKPNNMTFDDHHENQDSSDDDNPF